MEEERLHIEEDIRRASTLPASVYADPEIFQAARERIFARSWQFVGDTDRLKTPGRATPFTLLEGYLDEPLVLTRDADDRIHCFSNVCTHRGNLVVESDQKTKNLRCRYHGRRFGLDGRFQLMPEFEEVEDFPSEADHLPTAPFGLWEKLIFVGLDPAFSLDDLIGSMRARLDWLPLQEFMFDPATSRDYLVRANWALYIDNYLEGFHIPYVHSGLAGSLDYEGYQTEIDVYSNLQLAAASDGGDAFELPPSSPDYGRRIAAYYCWFFPNTMFNFYPWGLSINVVKPLAPDRTRISFLSYVWDPSRRRAGAGSDLDRVEREDEDIVENVQKGVRSRLYTRGRYSPRREKGVHHFHRLLVRFLGYD